MMLKGQIVKQSDEKLYIIAQNPKSDIVHAQQITECEIYLHDGRQLSPQQRNKIFALVSDISDYAVGVQLEAKKRKQWRLDMLKSLQLDYLIDVCDKEAVRQKLMHNYCQLVGIDYFSLSSRSPDSADMSTARDFIDWLAELCVTNGVPCTDTLLNRCEDISRYLYACVLNRTCAICGKRAEIHEWDRVGAGRDRKKIHHLGQRVQPLCRAHHREVDTIGQQSFDKKYHMSWVRLDERACKVLGWKQ